MQDEEEGEPQGKDDATEKGERRGDTGLEPGMRKERGPEMQDEEEGEPQGKDDATEKGERRGDTGLEPGMRKEWGVEMQDEEEGEPQGKDDATEKGEWRGDTGLEPGMTKEWGVEMQDEEEGEPQGKVISTFPDEDSFLTSLRQYLMSRHGRSRSNTEALQISREIGKYLFFADASSLNQKLLLSSSCLDRYLKHLEDNAIQPSTQKAKLCRLSQGVQFLSLGLDDSDLPKVERVKHLIKNWIAVGGREARTKNRNLLEDMTGKPFERELTEVDKFLQLHEMQLLTRELVRAAKTDKPVASKELRSLVLWLAGCLLYANHQRPGAIINITLAEYEESRVTTEGKSTYRTILVANHKTSTTGRAKVTVSGTFGQCLASYVRYLRKLLPESPLLFPNQHGKVLDHLSRHVKKLGEHYNLQLPTATESRHSAATVVTKTCQQTSQQAVAVMMSHSARTQERYYAAIKGVDDAVEGYKIMEGLRQKAPPSHSTSTRLRVPFSDEEVETLESYFYDHIETLTAPSESECREFLKEHPMNREAKQVRDKVRHFIKLNM